MSTKKKYFDWTDEKKYTLSQLVLKYKWIQFDGCREFIRHILYNGKGTPRTRGPNDSRQQSSEVELPASRLPPRRHSEYIQTAIRSQDDTLLELKRAGPYY